MTLALAFENHPECGLFPADPTHVPSTTNVNRIINGRVVNIHRPWAANIYTTGEKGVNCTGAVLSEKHIITAAHCFCDSRVVCKLANVDQ